MQWILRYCLEHPSSKLEEVDLVAQFSIACFRGYGKLVKLLWDLGINLTRGELIRSFDCAWKGGHLKITKRLSAAGSIKLTDKARQMGIDDGNIALLRWYVSLEEDGVHQDNCDIFFHAVAAYQLNHGQGWWTLRYLHSSLRVLRWLIEQTKNDIQIRYLCHDHSFWIASKEPIASRVIRVPLTRYQIGDIHLITPTKTASEQAANQVALLAAVPRKKSARSAVADQS